MVCKKLYGRHGATDQSRDYGVDPIAGCGAVENRRRDFVFPASRPISSLAPISAKLNAPRWKGPACARVIVIGRLRHDNLAARMKMRREDAQDSMIAGFWRFYLWLVRPLRGTEPSAWARASEGSKIGDIAIRAIIILCPFAEVFHAFTDDFGKSRKGKWCRKRDSNPRPPHYE
jgi:hypothetical protein